MIVFTYSQTTVTGVGFKKDSYLTTIYYNRNKPILVKGTK